MGLRNMLAKLLGERDRPSQATNTGTTPPPSIDIAQAESNQNIDESALIEEFFRADTQRGVMLDVGAHFGGTSKPFIDMGWKVVAFEPDKKKHRVLRELAQSHRNFKLQTCAVGSEPQEDVQFFTSEESTGIASLVPFRESHTGASLVAVRTLRDVLESMNIDRVDYLKIDAEGYDLRVIQGFPFERMTPRVVLCEFEDAKTTKIGYSTDDLGKALIDLGYSVYMSEWHPIVRYGITHRWRSLREYPCALTDQAGWGNFIAVRPGEDERKLRNILHRYMNVANA